MPKSFKYAIINICISIKLNKTYRPIHFHFLIFEFLVAYKTGSKHVVYLLQRKNDQVIN